MFNFETYPRESMQIKDTMFGHLPGYVPLSAEQEKLLNEKSETFDEEIVQLVMQI